MSMNAADREILTRYEELGMVVDEIAADLGYDADAVRLSLTQNSAMYRNTLRVGSEKEAQIFSQIIEGRAARVMEQLLDSDDDQVRFRAARFVIDERKGRNDAAVRGLKEAQRLGVGVLALNAALKRARQLRLASAGEIADKQNSIDVPSETTAAVVTV